MIFSGIISSGSVEEVFENPKPLNKEEVHELLNSISKSTFGVSYYDTDVDLDHPIFKESFEKAGRLLKDSPTPSIDEMCFKPIDEHDSYELNELSEEELLEKENDTKFAQRMLEIINSEIVMPKLEKFVYENLGLNEKDFKE